MKKQAILIGSDKGGVGKSLFSRLLIDAMDLAVSETYPDARERSAHLVKVGEIDHARRLTAIMPNRVDISLDPHELATSGLPSGMSPGSQFDRIYDLWISGNSITDLGANVTTPLLDWMRNDDILGLSEADDLHYEFVAVASADDQALRSAVSSIEAVREVLGRRAVLSIVLNDVGSVAGFAPFQGTKAWNDVERLCSQGVHRIDIPRCQSNLLEWARGASVMDLLKPKSPLVDEICRNASFSRVQRHREMNRIIEWLRSVQQGLEPLFERLHASSDADDRVVALESRRAG